MVQNWKFSVPLLIYSSFGAMCINHQQYHVTGCKEARLHVSCIWRANRSVYCLLRNVRYSLSLRVFHKWETFKMPNHPYLASVEKEHFFQGTHHLTASLEKGSKYYLKSEFKSWRSLFAMCSRLLSRDPSLVKILVVPALSITLEGMILPHSFLDSYLMGF